MQKMLLLELRSKLLDRSANFVYFFLYCNLYFNPTITFDCSKITDSHLNLNTET